MTATLPEVPERGAKVLTLRQWRKRRLMTQRQLATAANVAQSTIVRAEAGDTIDLATIGRLAAALDVPPDSLFGGEDSADA